MNIIHIRNRDAMMKMTPQGQACLISIQSPENYPRQILMRGWRASIRFVFHDISKPEFGYIEFNDEMAARMHSFIVRNLGAEFWVHCDAGLSRSMAVGCFMRDWFSYSLNSSFDTDAFRNVLVYSLLSRFERMNTG